MMLPQATLLEESRHPQTPFLGVTLSHSLVCFVKSRSSVTAIQGQPARAGDTVHCCTLLLQAWRVLQPAPRWNPREARARSGSHTLSSQPRRPGAVVKALSGTFRAACTVWSRIRDTRGPQLESPLCAPCSYSGSQ